MVQGFAINGRQFKISATSGSEGELSDLVFMRDLSGNLIAVVSLEDLGIRDATLMRHLVLPLETEYDKSTALEKLGPLFDAKSCNIRIQQKSSWAPTVNSSACSGCDAGKDADSAACDIFMDAAGLAAGGFMAYGCATVVGCGPGIAAGLVVGLSGAWTRYLCKSDAIKNWLQCRADNGC